jgi:hypothetical protein
MPINLDDLSGMVLSEEDLDGTDPTSATGDEMTVVAGRVFEAVTGEKVTLQRTNDWEEGESYSGWVHTEDEVFEFTIESDGEDWVLDVTEFDPDQQERDIDEVIYGATRERPAALFDLLRAMNKRLSEGDNFADAWNELTEANKEMGGAIADWKEQELVPRIGYTPSSDALDACLERWALMDEFKG